MYKPKQSSKIIYTWLVLFIFSLSYSYSQKAFIPEPSLNVISDYQNLLSEEEKSLLAKDIKGEYNSNSNQLMVVFIPTSYLGELTIEDYAQQLFDKWQPGQKGLDNGVMIIIAGSKMDSIGRKLRIHTGYGLEGALPDILCGRIEKEQMVPELKKGNYYKAIKNGSASILNFISKENIGRAPQYKVAPVKSGDLVFDYARIFSEKEKEQLEEELNASFNSEKRVINTEINYIFASDIVHISSRNAYDTTLFTISYNPGYYTDEKDSTLKFDETRKTYYLTYSDNTNAYGYGDYEAMYKYEGELAKQIKTNGIFALCMQLIAREKVAYVNHLNFFLEFTACILSATFFLFLISRFTKKYKDDPKKKRPVAIKISLGIILVILMLYSIFSLVTFEISYYISFKDYINLSSLVTVLWMVVLGISHILNVIFIFNIDTNYFNSKLFSWVGKGGGGSGGGYSGSSYSSSSRSSSSSSSSSSRSSGSSNGGYYGGGGKSGGGGASSDW